jgi:hypothetical protein
MNGLPVPGLDLPRGPSRPLLRGPEREPQEGPEQPTLANVVGQSGPHERRGRDEIQHIVGALIHE